MRSFLTVALTLVMAVTAVPSIKAEAAVYIPDEAYNFSAYNFEDEYSASSEDSYKILAIGNSITYHPACQYWWGNWGMAASSRDKDYIHQVAAGLEDVYGNVGLDIISFSSWERTGIRNTILSNIDPILSNDYDLVIIQLGENSHDLTAFESEYETLITYVQNSIPNAQIVLVGDYWVEKNRDTLKQNVANKLGYSLVDIRDFRDNPKYRSAVGKKVYGDDGQIHEIDFPAVGAHPNDLAMEAIATRIIDSLN